MSEVYRFGPFELQVDRHELLRAGAPLRIEPKPLEVLAELVRHAGELVTKTELMESVWEDRVVTESVIARCINKLRAALDDESQTLICTVHGYGYRFTGKVVSVDDKSVTEVDGVAVEPPRAGDMPPLRPNWRLAQVLDNRRAVWLAIHEKTGEKRVFKYGLEPQRVRSLRREISIHRLLDPHGRERSHCASRHAQQRLDRARARRPWLVAATLTLIVGTCVSLWESSRRSDPGMRRARRLLSPMRSS